LEQLGTVSGHFTSPFARLMLEGRHMLKSFSRLKSQPAKINVYFWNATKCYIETGQQVFFTAAVAAAATAASIQRASMIVLLRRIVVEIGADTEVSTAAKHKIRDRVSLLLDLIESSDWPLLKRIAFYRSLREQNATLERALHRTDASVFAKEYPSLRALRSLATTNLRAPSL
jgi:hypothetical protein